MSTKLTDDDPASTSSIDMNPINVSVVSQATSISDLVDEEDPDQLTFAGTLFRKRSRVVDPDSIATKRSVFDDPFLAPHYWPKKGYENTHRFDPSARWTYREEQALVRKIDWRIMVIAAIGFSALNLDRSNVNQANSTSFLKDLKLTTDGIVSAVQFWLKGRTSFLVCRSLLGILQGGFIPDLVLYLSYFYTKTELPIRLALFWMSMYLCSIVGSFLAYGILHLDGVAGHTGWRWLFLIDFNFHQGDMHNREGLTLKRLWTAICDYDLWPIYILGLMFGIPSNPPATYLTLLLRSNGFNTFQTNLLTIPSQALGIATTFLVTLLSEFVGERTMVAMSEDLWTLPFLVALYALPSNPSSWLFFAIVTGLLSYPYTHAIQVGWCSRNAGAVASRTVNASLYNM
ncbi:hypothetical protein ID866_4242 [Astraeus odoratus]|nr:hypothetical protein ID866_4242 [Astraeus odoratus]